jgi:hypothetical protein
VQIEEPLGSKSSVALNYVAKHGVHEASQTRDSTPITRQRLETYLSPRPILASELSPKYPPLRSRTITFEFDRETPI